MINGRNVSNLLFKNDIAIYKNIRKTATGQRGDYATGCLLDYQYFKNKL